MDTGYYTECTLRAFHIKNSIMVILINTSSQFKTVEYLIVRLMLRIE